MADVAALVFDIDSSQARTAATDLAKLGDASVRASGGADKLNKTIRDSRGRFKSSFDVARQYGSEVQALAAKYNPALSAVYKYQQAQVELNRAVALGVLTQNQADAALTAHVTATNAAANAMQRAGQMSSFASNNIRNLGFQVNDIAMMSLTGQSLLYLIPQQGLQVVQVMNDIKASGQGLGASLKGAIGQVLNPMALFTLGAVGAAAAVIQFGMSLVSSSKDVKTLDDAMSSMKSSVDALKSSQEQSRRTVLDLVKDYGLLASVARQAMQNMAEADRVKAALDIADALRASIDEVTRYSWSGVSQGLDASIAQVGQLSIEWVNVSQAMDQVRVAQSDLDKIAAARNLSKEMLAAYGSIEKMPAEMRQLYFNLQDSILSLSAARAATNDWAGAMSGVLSYIDAIRGSLNNISGGAIRLAAIKTETDLLRQGKSLREASLASSKQTAQLEGAKKTAELEKQYGWAGRILGIAQQNQQLAIIGAEAELDLARDAAREREKASAGGGGGGAAARELAQAQKGFQSLRELMEKESLFQVAEWEKRQAQLDQALAKDLLTRENYELLKQQLQQMYFGSEYERDALNYQMKIEQLKEYLELDYITRQQYNARKAQTDWEYINQSLDLNSTAFGAQLNGMAGFMGNLNSLAGGGYEKLLKAQQVFAAASAFISAWNGYALTIGDPTVPAWMKIALAGKVLAAGLGAVAAIKGGGKGGGGSTGAASAAKAEPQRNVLVRLEGDEWLVSMADTIMTQIYDATGNGRVVVARDF